MDTKLTLESNVHETIPCGIKALATATVGWIHNGMILPVIKDNETTNCTGMVVTREVDIVDEEYALHKATLHLCNTIVNNSNTYTCSVIENGEIVSELSVSIDITEPVVPIRVVNSTSGLLPSQSHQSGIIIIIYITVPLVLCILVAITVATLVVVARKLRLTSHKQNVETTKFHTNNNIYQSDVSDPMKWEYPRDSLQYLHELGSGRFGHVYLAQLKMENKEKMVAIKTHKLGKDNNHSSHHKIALTFSTGNKYGNASSLVDELEIMKSIKPHNNICNLIGQCTTLGESSEASIYYTQLPACCLI